MARLLSVLMVLLAAPKTPRTKGIESPGYRWGALRPETTTALELRGDVQRGGEAYAVCVPCHTATGVGSGDGRFPRLAGQHASVVIKQLSDIRVGLRDNPVMYPYAATLSDPQELADLAAYIAALPGTAGHGRGPGTRLAQGKVLYERDCVGCHGAQGEGSAAALYPRLDGQHYRYLVRQLTETRNQQRRNANPAMVAVLKRYAPEELEAVSDYLSRLER